MQWKKFLYGFKYGPERKSCAAPIWNVRTLVADWSRFEWRKKKRARKRWFFPMKNRREIAKRLDTLAQTLANRSMSIPAHALVAPAKRVAFPWWFSHPLSHQHHNIFRSSSARKIFFLPSTVCFFFRHVQAANKRWFCFHYQCMHRKAGSERHKRKSSTE